MFTKKAHSCQNSLEKSYTERKAKHIPSGCACSLICSFDATKNKRGYYRGEDCIDSLCKKLKELVLEIINYEEKEIILLTDEESKSYEKQKVCHLCKKEFCIDENDKNTFKLYHKVRDHCNYTGKFSGAAHNICNLGYKTPKEIPVVAHNATYDYHFLIKQLAKEFEGQFECLGENTEEYITFSVPIKKELDNSKAITYQLKLLIALDLCQIDYMSVKDNQLIFQCLECKKNNNKDWNKEFIKRFANTYRFCNRDINKLIW